MEQKDGKKVSGKLLPDKIMSKEKQIELARTYMRIAHRTLKINEDLFDSNPNEHYLESLELAETRYNEARDKLLQLLEEK